MSSSELEQPGYAELMCRSHYSFLRGGSSPQELMLRASELGLKALALTDWDGVYGIPKAYLMEKELRREGRHVPKLIVGADLEIDVGGLNASTERCVFLVRDRAAYGVLCRMITDAHSSNQESEWKKERITISWEQLLSHVERPGWKGIVALSSSGSEEFFKKMKELCADRIHYAWKRVLDGSDFKRSAQATSLEQKLGILPVVVNDVHYHVRERRRLQDLLTCIREGVSIHEAGYRLFSNRERYLKSAREMHFFFKRSPDALARSLEIAESCSFHCSELRYRYPSEWIPQGETAQGYLEKLVWRGAAEFRYPEGVPPGVQAQIRHELALISELRFADYFLTIWEIVEFAREKKILCQGRGSAANSVVCYCLGITAIDPVKMGLLFERFISVERGEPPDIDVDFEHERREEVIQHIYSKYGRHRAGMVAALITYRGRSSLRDLGKAIGIPADGKLKRQPTPEEEKLLTPFMPEIEGFPRHLSIHSGGFTFSAEPIIETVPIQPARMEGRTIVQWDKYDLDAIGLLKVDVLSLGMLTAIRKSFEIVNHQIESGAVPLKPGMPRILTLASIPDQDPETYDMIGRSDTVGVFQIESRAQMNMLGRLQPRSFYDLVIEVALVRPGPISGKMVHPYLKRRKGEEPVHFEHSKLKEILGKTLGVPIFQEQVMKMAVELAGFTPGESDELRRSMGTWRLNGTIGRMGERLAQGLRKSRLSEAFILRVIEQVKGFSEYGFPESHAASFALIAYVSSYLKCHHPAEFCCSLINSQPMGFYSNHTLLEDTKHHGVKIHELDLNTSVWDCDVPRPRELRLGFRVVHGIREADYLMMHEERTAGGPFLDLGDFLKRTRFSREVLYRIAMAGAFERFGMDQRHTLWALIEYESRRIERKQQDLFAADIAHSKSLFAGMDLYASINADHQAYGISLRGHPMEGVRQRVPLLPKTTTVQVKKFEHGERVSFAGMVIVRQRPPTAKGTAFATLEDEHGLLDLIFHKKIFEKNKDLIHYHSLLMVTGVVQRDGYSASVLVKSLKSVI